MRLTAASAALILSALSVSARQAVPANSGNPPAVAGAGTQVNPINPADPQPNRQNIPTGGQPDTDPKNSKKDVTANGGTQQQGNQRPQDKQQQNTGKPGTDPKKKEKTPEQIAAEKKQATYNKDEADYLPIEQSLAAGYDKKLEEDRAAMRNPTLKVRGLYKTLRARNAEPNYDLYIRDLYKREAEAEAELDLYLRDLYQRAAEAEADKVSVWPLGQIDIPSSGSWSDGNTQVKVNVNGDNNSGGKNRKLGGPQDNNGRSRNDIQINRASRKRSPDYELYARDIYEREAEAEAEAWAWDNNRGGGNNNGNRNGQQGNGQQSNSQQGNGQQSNSQAAIQGAAQGAAQGLVQVGANALQPPAAPAPAPAPAPQGPQRRSLPQWKRSLDFILNMIAERDAAPKAEPGANAGALHERDAEAELDVYERDAEPDFGIYAREAEFDIYEREAEPEFDVYEREAEPEFDIYEREAEADSPYDLYVRNLYEREASPYDVYMGEVY